MPFLSPILLPKYLPGPITKNLILVKNSCHQKSCPVIKRLVNVSLTVKRMLALRLYKYMEYIGYDSILP